MCRLPETYETYETYEEGEERMTGRVLRETSNYRAVEARQGVRITAKDPRAGPRSRLVSPATWRILSALTDAAFDGSCVLEVGIGTWAKSRGGR